MSFTIFDNEEINNDNNPKYNKEPDEEQIFSIK